LNKNASYRKRYRAPAHQDVLCG